jgi:hypothetical protein
MRWWNESVAAISDVVPLPLLAFLSILAAALLALALYFWPHWLPWRWSLWRRRRDRSAGPDGKRPRFRFRFGAFRWRWRWLWRRRKRRGRPEPAPDELAPDELPDLPAQVLALTADDLAAQGRYAEAVRERLRAIVRELIERGVIPHTPGWTVTELAHAASRVRPSLAGPLTGAANVFSEIWYGLRPATAEDDRAMRGYADAVRVVLAEPVGASVGGGS